ncbi:hypothetical protein Cgig2_025227 [Carnegiea gigantea]|uniref:Uncharacterized protein n=1 Tax=Carnegiea gigantea TaxID=171969 RepID=A0A9Q1QMM5_9CARY|nr:hypothetical protein Cgig2_025227 [Carnegiea gigantea]
MGSHFASPTPQGHVSGPLYRNGGARVAHRLLSSGPLMSLFHPKNRGEDAIRTPYVSLGKVNNKQYGGALYLGGGSGREGTRSPNPKISPSTRNPNLKKTAAYTSEVRRLVYLPCQRLCGRGGSGRSRSRPNKKKGGREAPYPSETGRKGGTCSHAPPTRIVFGPLLPSLATHTRRSTQPWHETVKNRQVCKRVGACTHAPPSQWRVGRVDCFN